MPPFIFLFFREFLFQSQHGDAAIDTLLNSQYRVSCVFRDIDYVRGKGFSDLFFESSEFFLNF